MSWTVRLDPQPSQWLRQLAVTHPQLSDRVVAAIDLLKELGPQAWPSADPGSARPPGAKPHWDGRKILRFYFTDDPAQRIVRIIRAAPPRALLTSCDVVFERASAQRRIRWPIRPALGLPLLSVPAPERRSAPLAHGLPAVAARLLPKSERDRYSEEWASELWEMADAGAGWWRQTVYACRLLLGAWALRAALGVTHGPEATPLWPVRPRSTLSGPADLFPEPPSALTIPRHRLACDRVDITDGQASIPPAWPDDEQPPSGAGSPQPGGHPRRRRRAIRLLLRGVTIAGGGAGTLGASLAGRQGIAVATLILTVVIVIGELWTAKRRDDLFSKVATQPQVNPAVLRELTIHEAVRAGRLSSEDTVRLLSAEPGGDSARTPSQPPSLGGAESPTLQESCLSAPTIPS